LVNAVVDGSVLMMVCIDADDAIKVFKALLVAKRDLLDKIYLKI